ncbi:AraC family transcriptional regulator [Paenibacillus sp. HWE-109]|uniref:AraC family transcriptional regulator n=1 Tax=Paenibacillus sp. HWE-109 TaxID=1306526 RepID=UPI001EDE4AE7|nr:AraC family transcriptional regulator [Paenibacillus sp. HWE-109]UKS28037.1 AraC family transcriptional regulator [Paenibacillus sp. HWE-109]
MVDIVYLENQLVLNQYVTKLPGKDICFFMQTFGAFADHTINHVHRHSFIEICYILSGSAVYTESGIAYPVETGTMFITRPGLWHSLTSEKGAFVLWLGFDVIGSESSDEGIRIYESLKTSKKTFLSDCHSLNAAILWRMIYGDSANKILLPQDYFTNLLHTLILTLCDSFSDHSVKRSAAKSKPSRHTSSFLLYQARQFIEDNISQNLHLETVANYLHVSGRHLSRIFNNEIGLSFSRYVRKEKIELAIALLTNSDLEIKQISEEIGCDTVQYFTKIFKSETGVTPGKYRLEARLAKSSN